MTIVVLHYPTTDAVIIPVDYHIIENEYDGSTERYLTEHCGYDLSEINYMAGDGVSIIPASHESFDDNK